MNCLVCFNLCMMRVYDGFRVGGENKFIAVSKGKRESLRKFEGKVETV